MLSVAALCVPALAIQAADQTDDQFFRQQVEPILVKRCLECHAAEGRGGLDLRTKAATLKGGESGGAVIPHKPDDSLLFEYVSTQQMPPKKPLPEAEVALLKQWIARGAYFPERTLDPYAFTTDRRAGYDWWSLQPLKKPAVPKLADATRVRTPVDQFLLSLLLRAGLSFSPPADRATYIRRVTFDLHGLPPTYEEVRAFEQDQQPDAFERLVDRLLASPRYGERWGRHWLDVVRFAESNGFERDRLRPNFWRYRDYVIDALNRDLPYDKFIREQLAGDAIRPGDPQALIATGFLVAGPKNDVGTISELERLTTRQDELDEFVIATGTTFLGLTVGCARCHDHKFDPIPARDYYSLTAVFSGLDRDDNIVAPPEEVARRAAAVKLVQDRIDGLKSQINQLLAPVRTRLLAEQMSAKPQSSDAVKLPMVSGLRNEDPFPPAAARFVRLTIVATNEGSQPCLDELEIYGADPKQNLALASGGAKASASTLLPGYPIHQIAHLNDGKYGNSWSWISNEPGKGWTQIELPRMEMLQRVVWGRDREGKYADRLPIDYRIELSEDGQKWALASSSQRRLPYKNGATKSEPIPPPQLLAALTPEQRASHEQLTAAVSAAEAELAQIPVLPVSYSARNGGLQDAFVLKRGNVRERGEKVEPAALSSLPQLPLPAIENDSGPERRRRFADWVVDPRNPLTARVLVNRVWHYHFGQGIVNTPSDFGFNGDRPSHPELLDWLAADFIEHGWTLKRLHRLIMLSEAYRQSSQQNQSAAAVDGSNRWLWRMNPRRLESEAVRDAILQTSGKLDLTLGGPSFRLFQYRDGNVPDYLLLDKAGPETWRRAVYMFNIRTFHEPLMTVFDCPDPSVQTPRREQSTTALQALSLMNNTFTFEQTQHFADRVTTAAGAAPEKQATAAYRLTFGRDPTPQETARAVEFITKHDLFSLCRVLLNSNEFLYVR
jgi:mono/diheme cytochrome c family protein